MIYWAIKLLLEQVIFFSNHSLFIRNGESGAREFTRAPLAHAHSLSLLAPRYTYSSEMDISHRLPSEDRDVRADACEPLFHRVCCVALWEVLSVQVVRRLCGRIVTARSHRELLIENSSGIAETLMFLLCFDYVDLRVLADDGLSNGWCKRRLHICVDFCNKIKNGNRSFDNRDDTPKCQNKHETIKLYVFYLSSIS